MNIIKNRIKTIIGNIITASDIVDWFIVFSFNVSMTYRGFMRYGVLIISHTNNAKRIINIVIATGFHKEIKRVLLLRNFLSFSSCILNQP